MSWKIYKSMSAEEEACCACGIIFIATSLPRMMPACEHSACTSCLRDLLARPAPPPLICRHCGHSEPLAGVDLEYFPKNITLTKLLQKRLPPTRTQEESLLSSSGASTSSELCKVHGKELQLVCLNDRVRLCTLCALFGSHKDHRFKTLSEAKALMEQTQTQFQSYRKRKAQLQQRLSSSEFREGVVKRITAQKDRLLAEIKAKFAEIMENITLAEKKAYEEVGKNFKIVYAKITALIKEENDSQRRYKQWEAKCTELFQKAERAGSIEDKVSLYCGGPLEICSQGEALLTRLEGKIDSNIATIQALISQIRIVQTPGICKSVFNFISVVLDDSEPIQGILYVQQEVLSTRTEETPREHKIEFSATHLSPARELIFNRESVSPAVRRKSKSKEKMGPSEKRKEMVSPERANVSALIDEFCEKENLDTLDLTGYGLSDSEIYEVLAYLRPVKKVKGLKLVKNRLTNEGLARIIELIPCVTNINLSFNLLSDDSIITLLANRTKISSLRIINLSNNKINERKTKNAIEQLKKQGVIVTI